MRAKAPEIYYPSFTLALLRAESSSRSSYFYRYHPYLRYELPPAPKEPLMCTIDHRHQSYNFDPMSTITSLDEEENEMAYNLEAAVSTNGRAYRKKIQDRRLASLIIDLALAVRRKLRASRTDA